MSLESWKKEFYPVDASYKHTDIEAIEHGIKKWKGFNQENLDKHKLKRENETLFESDDLQQSTKFVLDVSTCSLCLKYFLKDCEKCPLYLIDECCLTAFSRKENTAYNNAVNTGNPTELIEALKKALIYSKENS